MFPQVNRGCSFSRSDSSSDMCKESDCGLLDPVPLSYVHTAPLLEGPASSVVEDDLADWQRKYSHPLLVALREPMSRERSLFIRLSSIPASGG